MKHKLGRVCFRCYLAGRKRGPCRPPPRTPPQPELEAAAEAPWAALPQALREREALPPTSRYDSRHTGGTPENAHWELFHSFENVQNKTLIGTFEGYLPFIHTDRSGGGKGAEYFREESKWRSKSTLANHTFSSLFTDRTLLYNDSLLKAVK